jgi:hypothetical protein
LDKIDLLIPSIALFGFAALVRLRQGSVLAPAAFFSFTWTVHVALSFVVPYYRVWSGTVWWILLTCILLYVGTELGGVLGSVALQRSEAEHGLRRIQFPWPIASLILCFVCGAAYNAIGQLSGLNLSVAKPPFYVQALLPFQFAGPMLGGLLFGGGVLRGRRAWFTVLPLLAPAILALLYTGRTTIAAPILSWVAGYFAMRIHVERGYDRILRTRQVFLGICLLGLLLFIGLGLQHVRRLRRPNSTAAEVVQTYLQDASWDGMIDEWERFRYFTFGQVYAFSWYFEQAWTSPPEPLMGKMVLAGPIDFLGFEDRTISYVASFEAERGIWSNVFTMLRPPIDDFGLIGSLIWWMGIGTLQGWAHARVRRGFIGAIALVIWFYLDISLVGGFFLRYNSVIVAYLLMACYTIQAKRLTKRATVAGTEGGFLRGFRMLPATSGTIRRNA